MSTAKTAKITCPRKKPVLQYFTVCGGNFSNHHVCYNSPSTFLSLKNPVLLIVAAVRKIQVSKSWNKLLYAFYRKKNPGNYFMAVFSILVMLGSTTAMYMSLTSSRFTNFNISDLPRTLSYQIFWVSCGIWMTINASHTIGTMKVDSMN